MRESGWEGGRVRGEVGLLAQKQEFKQEQEACNGKLLQLECEVKALKESASSGSSSSSPNASRQFKVTRDLTVSVSLTLHIFFYTSIDYNLILCLDLYK